MPNFTFWWGHGEHKTTTFCFFFFPEVWYSPLEFNPRLKNSSTILNWRNEFEQDGISAIKCNWSSEEKHTFEVMFSHPSLSLLHISSPFWPEEEVQLSGHINLQVKMLFTNWAIWHTPLLRHVHNARQNQSRVYNHSWLANTSLTELSVSGLS